MANIATSLPDRRPINSALQMLLYIIVISIDDVQQFQKHLYGSVAKLLVFLVISATSAAGETCHRVSAGSMIRTPAISFHLLILFFCQAELINFEKFA